MNKSPEGLLSVERSLIGGSRCNLEIDGSRAVDGGNKTFWARRALFMLLSSMRPSNFTWICCMSALILRTILVDKAFLREASEAATMEPMRSHKVGLSDSYYSLLLFRACKGNSEAG